MSFFIKTNESVDSIIGEELTNPNALLECYINAEASKLPYEERKAFAESDEAQVLVEKQVLNKRTLVRLSKNDDLARRVKMAAFQIAKQKKDPLWTKLVKNRVIERALIKKIVQKYNNQAVRVARISQRDYIKTAKNSKHLPTPASK